MHLCSRAKNTVSFVTIVGFIDSNKHAILSSPRAVAAVRAAYRMSGAFRRVVASAGRSS